MSEPNPSLNTAKASSLRNCCDLKQYLAQDWAFFSLRPHLAWELMVCVAVGTDAPGASGVDPL